MFGSLDIFQTSAAMAKHAGARQAVTAANVANSDTPGYQAKRLAAFSEVYATSSDTSLRASRAGHIGGAFNGSRTAELTPSNSEPAPNGNAVSVEEEMFHSVEIGREHSRALAIYRHALTVLRTTIGR